jgi:hypothetical protein
VLGDDCVNNWQDYLDVMLSFYCRQRWSLLH